jgi:hypothetical protein
MEELGKSGSSRRPTDFKLHTQWVLRDLTQFGKTLKLLENDITRLKDLRAVQSLSIHELQGHILKGIVT